MSIHVAVVSLTSTSDKNKNLAWAEDLVREAASRKAQWVVLPEMLSYFGPYENLWDIAEHDESAPLQKISSLAAELGVTIFAGSFPERPVEASNAAVKKIYNTQYVFSPKGKMIAKYRKIHLFEAQSMGNQVAYRESDGFLAGSERVRFVHDGLKVGLATCYDLRFGEFFAALVGRDPVDVLVIPSAFTLNTGMDHWELLLRARAVEWQCYVVAPNQVGSHSSGKNSYGHSMIIDPWGNKLADTGNVPGVATAVMTHERLQQCRALLPALSNRRFDVYR